MVAFCGQ